MEGRALIVNADDFGMSPGVNRGIIRAHEHGIVTSASFMTRGRAAAEAAAYGRDCASLDLGLHVDLAEWRYAAGKWILVYRHADTDDAEAVAAEVRAQLESFRVALGREPTHLDSHQHLHRSEPLHSVLAALATELGVPLRWYTPGLTTIAVFYGQDAHGTPMHEMVGSAALGQLLRELPMGVSELMCHPGVDDDAGGAYVEERSIECRSLCDAQVREAVAAAGIELVTFRERDLDGVTSAGSEGCVGIAAMSTGIELEQQAESPKPGVELVELLHASPVPGVSLLTLEGRWSPGHEPRGLALTIGAGDDRRRLTELPWWGPSSAQRAEPGATWRLEYLVATHRLAQATLTLHLGEHQVLELGPPRAAGEGGAGPADELIRAVRLADEQDRAAMRLLAGRPEAELRIELEQRIRMTEALEAQNRGLRTRMADLEDALARAQHAASLAGQLQELIDAEAVVSTARGEFEAARQALRAGIFAGDGGDDATELRRIGEQERLAREALEVNVEQLDRARAGVLRAFPDPA